MGKSLGPINFEDISISPNYRKSHWQEALANNDWKRMVDIFKDRIEGRFLKPIRLIANDRDIGEFSGFAILALDCLIIETLNQFYSGLDETEGQHREAFWKFLRIVNSLKVIFLGKEHLLFTITIDAEYCTKRRQRKSW